MEPDQPCHPGTIWDRRFRVLAAPNRAGLTIGPLGPAAATLRRRSSLPAAILQTLPALRHAGRLFAVPHLGYYEDNASHDVRIAFDPGTPAAGAPFFAPSSGELGPGFALGGLATYLS
jgi:tRNA(Ile)-lysidine synthase